MRGLFPYVFIFVLNIYAVSFSQHKGLLEIIYMDIDAAQKERKIDSFFNVNLGKIAPGILADCYHDLGSKWYYPNWENTEDKSQLQKAIWSTLQALQIKRNLESLEQCSLNKTLNNLGFFYSLNENFYEAIKIYRELDTYGTEYCIGNREKDKVIFARDNLGSLYLITGDYYKAIETYVQIISSISQLASISPEEKDTLIEAYIELADIYFQMDVNKFSESILENLNSAALLIDSTDVLHTYYENRINQLEGNRLSEIGQYKYAIGSYQQVIANLDPSDSLNLAIAYNSLGLAQLELKEKVIAEEILLNAISLNPKYDAPYNNLGDLYRSNNQYKKALSSYQKAMDLSLDRNLELDFDELPDSEEFEYAARKIELLNHIVTKANAWLSYYEYDKNKDHLQDALDTFTLADQLVDQIRYTSNEQTSKLFWREKSSALYMKAVEVCYILDKPAVAFYFMERNKALLLLEDLTQEEAKDIANLPQELAEREFKLKRAIFLSENSLFETVDGSKDIIDSLKSTVNENKYVYQEFIDSLNTAFPDYAKFKQKEAILPFNELKSNYLSNQQAVLHYILNEDDGFGLLTTHDTSILFQLDDTAKLNEDIDTMIHLLSNGRSDTNILYTTSYSLFKKLIPETIYTKITGKQLTIIPDYTLQRIPFETLVVDHTNLKFLIEDTEISYVYSMSLIDHNSRSTWNHTKQLLSLAPVTFEEQGLASLLSSEKEVAGIAQVFQGDIFIKEEASKVNFLKQADQHQIIHFATHADMGDGENPWIAFRDEKMYLKEIYANKNPSDMVVLSACNTSSGNLKRGEGIMSLARGFFYSGAKSVVSSLWPITDGPGKDIMISFYQNLDKGYSKSKALRQAKLDYMNSKIVEELKHPFYWAGFIVVGDNAPLVASRNPIWIYVGIVLVLAIVYFLRRKLFK
ncbi:MAG: CHAT domain-containing protein [Eudoraea sp.]